LKYVRIYACLLSSLHVGMPLDFGFAIGQEISKELFLGTPWPQKETKFVEGYLP
jgi:hypothetical protein